MLGEVDPFILQILFKNAFHFRVLRNCSRKLRLRWMDQESLYIHQSSMTMVLLKWLPIHTLFDRQFRLVTTFVITLIHYDGHLLSCIMECSPSSCSPQLFCYHWKAKKNYLSFFVFGQQVEALWPILWKFEFQVCLCVFVGQWANYLQASLQYKQSLGL